MDPVVLVIGFALAPDLNTGIEVLVVHDFELQLEIAVILLRAEEGIGAVWDGSAHDHVVLGIVMSQAVLLFPTAQIFAVVERGPIALRAGSGNGERDRQSG